MLSGLLLVSVLLRWVPPRVLALSAAFLLIFLLNNFTSELGARWIFPINNNVGRRILPSAQALEFFRACGMPVTDNLLALTNEYANGQDRAFYNDPALEGYRDWLAAHGKFCYMQWLLASPVRSVGEVLSQFESLIRFEKVENFFARSYDPIIPYFVEPFIYPVKFVPALWLVLTLGALIAVWKRMWETNQLWGVYILLCMLILPHLFISWHGDAMAPERHVISVGLQLALSFWLLVFLIFDQPTAPEKLLTILRTPNLLQRLLHRFFMLRPVTAFFATRTHRIDGIILELTNGKHTLTELMGWNIVQLKTTGAKTGKPYTILLIGIIDGENIALIASSFGRRHNPGWYYNLKKTPECSVQLNGQSGKYLARETRGEEREKYWRMALFYYEGYEKYRQRAAHRQIPVMVLEPVK